jgi:hypothetical protein
LKMDLIEGSETSANINQTLGIHPKIETVNTEHSESLKSRVVILININSGFFRKVTTDGDCGFCSGLC